MNFFATTVAASLNLEHHSFRVGMKRMETASEFHASAGLLRFLREPLNQRATLDDEVGMLQGDCGCASICEKFKAANFVDDAAFGGVAQQRAHVPRDDQSARDRFQRFDALEYADGNSAASQQGSSEQSGGGPTNNRDA
jgi:hypothetical protein